MIVDGIKDYEGDGEWGDVLSWPIIPLHSIVLPDGNVLSFGTTEQGMQGGQFVYDLWDPVTNVHRTLPNTTQTNIFCSNMAIDPATGNVIIMGGDGAGMGQGGLSGIDDVVVFDYRTQTIRDADQGDMAFARWYGTVLTLPDGDLLVLGGRDENYNGSTIPEVFNAETGFRSLTGAEMPDFIGQGHNLDASWWYPHAFVASSGDVIVIEGHGDDVYRMTTDGAGTVQKVGKLPFDAYKLNSSVMFDQDKIMMIANDGGIWVGDLSTSTPTFQQVADLDSARTNAGLIVLPDGRVAITGGGSTFDQGNTLADAVKTVTIWDPQTNSLTDHEDAALARLYHSSALMLPDGTIFSGGGGAPGPLTNLNAEVFVPTYLFDADGNLAERPEITDAPKNIDSGDTFRITVDDANDIDIISASRSGAMTHARNSDSKFVKLEFTVVDATTIEITTPNEYIMSPGVWMLTVVDSQGVPSVSSLMGVDTAPLVDTPPLVANNPIYNNEIEQIDGAFELTVEARFDDLAAGAWQRVFDFGNGPQQDNILLGQDGASDDIVFIVWRDGTSHRITAADAIIEGEIATWTVRVDDDGQMSLLKNGTLVAEGMGVVPADVDREQNYVGASNWGHDPYLRGMVRNMEITNMNDDNSGETPSDNLLVNGGFEIAETITGWTHVSEIPGWQSSNGKFEVWPDGFDGVPATEGKTSIEIDKEYGIISQAVQTVKDQQYELSFDYHVRPGQESRAGIEVLWNGTVVATFQPGNADPGSYTVSVQGTGGSDVLGFRATESTADFFGGLLDNVVLKAETVDPENEVADIPNDTQFVTGTTDNDVFVVDGLSSDYGVGPTQDGQGIVVWGPTGFDILTGFEAVRFNDTTIPLVNEGDHILDIANFTQYLTGTEAEETFVIDGNASDYSWGPTQDGNGIIVWGPTGYDILTDFEAIRFNDATVPLVSDGNRYQDVENATQYLAGTDAEEVFVIDGNSSDYAWGPTADGLGIVVWGPTGHDILKDFDKIAFNDQTVSLVRETGPDGGLIAYDDPDQTQYEKGAVNETDRFVVDGDSSDYGWGKTGDGEGAIVWNSSGDSFDILYDFDEIAFNDQTVQIDQLG